MFSRLFWKLSAERAVKTFAQTLAGVLVVSGIGVFGDWRPALSAAAMAAVISVLTSVGSIGIGPEGSPSVVAECPPPAPAPAAVVTPATAAR